MIYLAPLVLLPATLALARRRDLPARGWRSRRCCWRCSCCGSRGPPSRARSASSSRRSRCSTRARSACKLTTGASRRRPLTLVGLGLAAAGVAIARHCAGRPRRLAGAPAIVDRRAPSSLVVPAQAQYALSKYVNGAGSKVGAQPARPRVRGHDGARRRDGRRVRRGRRARRPGSSPIWQEVQFYNQRIDRCLRARPDSVNPVPPGDPPDRRPELRRAHGADHFARAAARLPRDPDAGRRGARARRRRAARPVTSPPR